MSDVDSLKRLLLFVFFYSCCEQKTRESNHERMRVSTELTVNGAYHCVMGNLLTLAARRRCLQSALYWGYLLLSRHSVLLHITICYYPFALKHCGKIGASPCACSPKHTHFLPPASLSNL